MDIIENKNILGHNLTIYKAEDVDFLISANEIANIIENKNVSQMLKNIDEDEKQLQEIVTETGKVIRKWYLTEDGLYEVLLTSKKPIAKEFRKEVKKILKNIRINGIYFRINKNDSPEIIEKRINNLIKDLKIELNNKNKLITSFNNIYKEDKTTESLQFLADKYDMKLNDFVEFLNRNKVIYKRGNTYRLYREHKYKGYVKYYKKNNKYNLKFTVKGQLFLEKLFNISDNNEY